ncbi:MAG TPA: hypothetical protein VGL94_12280 [Ktedonobacteraceae bacterium]
MQYSSEYASFLDQREHYWQITDEGIQHQQDCIELAIQCDPVTIGFEITFFS